MNQTITAPASAPASTPHRTATRVYQGLTWLLAGAIVAQIFLAGMAILVDGDNLQTHRNFGGTISLMPVPLLIAAAFARLPWHRLALIASIYPLVIMQYVFIGMPRDGDMGFLRAFHVLNALLLLQLAIYLTRLPRRRSGRRDAAAE